MSVAGDVLVETNILYHALSVYVENIVLCGNDGILNFELKL